MCVLLQLLPAVRRRRTLREGVSERNTASFLQWYGRNAGVHGYVSEKNCRSSRFPEVITVKTTTKDSFL